VCYLTYLSTTSERDLTAFDADALRFMPLGNEPDDVEAARHLAYPDRWFVSFAGCCSCGLRRLDPLLNPQLPPWFSEPEDWCPEDPEDIEDTKHVYRVIEGLLAEGHRVDCLDVFPDDAGGPWRLDRLDVNLSEVGEARFRLFTGIRMVFGPSGAI